MVDTVEHAFAMSEASNMPAVLQLRIRACHVRGSFVCRDNRAPAISTRHTIDEPAGFDYARLAHPPVIYAHEKRKVEHRIPAAQRYIVEHGLNEQFDGVHAGLGLIVQGGLYNSLQRALQRLGLADAFGTAQIPMLVLNVTYPLVPQQVVDFCAPRSAVLVLEEGMPEYIEKDISAALRRAGVPTALHGKDLIDAQGEYNVEVLARGLIAFLDRHLPGTVPQATRDWLAGNAQRRADLAKALGAPLPPRPPNFCVGCPERPVFSALKLAQQSVGPVHVAADIGCHAFATFEPFSSGHSILGYGMSLASRAGVSPLMGRRVLSIMGDGGFWHNGLASGIGNAVFNQADGVIVIVDNNYSAATGGQDVLSSRADNPHRSTHHPIEAAVRGVGVNWVRTVDHTYDVNAMKAALKEALTTPFKGPKVVIAQSECSLNKQRRVKPQLAAAVQRGERVVKEKFGVDAAVCSGDHACMRLSGCPSLTLANSGDPLKPDPVAQGDDGCVACGHCGEVADAAVLCPSFYRIEWVRNASPWERRLHRWRQRVVGWLQARQQRSLQARALYAEVL
ncbi:MAG: indolepyruvate ferredoxin oxidoreductase [Burkholderiales bacterium PBB5]|nr:MAG: indolepyruvate ferredoxin oxidoreductase [Burkholderiales bacterium PBB5]